MADLGELRRNYRDELERILIFLSHDTAFNYWFCDQEDNVKGLIQKLEMDLSDFDPRVISLGRDSYIENHRPYSQVIIPAADDLSDQGIERAVLLVGIQDIPKIDDLLFFKKLCPDIDAYYELADGKMRYPVIFVSEQRFLGTYLDNSEMTIPNHTGFKRRMTEMRILKR